jgi:cell division septum initiation protein DivIVA
MSVIEPAALPAHDGGADLPEFPVAMRGYDKQKVDVFITEMKRHAEGERRRADHWERRAAQLQHELSAARTQPPSWDHLGPVAAQVLENATKSANLVEEAARNRGEAIVQGAEEQAGEVIQQAEERAAVLEATAQKSLSEASGERDRIINEATAEAEQLRAQAEEDAQQALEQTRDVAERIRERVRHEQITMQAETERLRGARDRMLAYLGRIHADLVELLAEASASPMGEAAAGSAPAGVSPYQAHDVEADEGELPAEIVGYGTAYGAEAEGDEEMPASASSNGGQQHEA